jgi:putative membrane protein
MRFVARMLISAAAVFGVAYLSDGKLLSVESFFPAAVFAALVLAVVNAVIKPVVHFFSLPVTIMSLGLFALVINAGMLYVVAWIVPGVDTTGFLATVAAALIISFANAIGTRVAEGDD